jgi:hypothetical protein
VTFDTQAAITDTGTLSGGALRLLGNGAVTLDNNGNDVDDIAANRTGSITFFDADALRVATVGGTTGVNSNGNGISLTALSATGDIVLNQAITGSTVSLNAGRNIDSTAGGAVNIVSAQVWLQAGLDAGATGTIGVTGGDTVQTNAGTSLTLNSDTTGAAAIAVDNGASAALADLSIMLANTSAGVSVVANTGDTVTMVAGSSAISGSTGNTNLTLTATAGGLDIAAANLAAGTGIVTFDTQAAITDTGSLSGAALRLMGNGAVTLDNAANDVDDIASARTGAFTFVDADSVRVATVGGTVGINSGGNAVSLTSSSATGDIVLNQQINAGAGMTTLVAGRNIDSTAGAAVNIVAGSASLQAGANAGATGSIGVTGGDTVETNVGGTLALNSDVTGAAAIAVDNGASAVLSDLSITLANTSAGVSVVANTGDTVSMVAGSSAISGSTGNANLTLIAAAGTLDIAAANLAAGTGAIIFDTQAAITDTGALTGAGLKLVGTGAVTLDSAGNDVNDIAAMRTGAITFVDADDLRVATVSGTVGVNSGGNAINLTASGATGDLTLNQAVTAAGSTATLVAGRNIDSTAGGAVNVTAGTASLQAGANGGATGTIGVTGGDDVQTNVGTSLTLNSDTVGASAIVVDNGAAATLTDLFVTLANTSAGVNVVVNAGDTITMAATPRTTSARSRRTAPARSRSATPMTSPWARWAAPPASRRAATTSRCRPAPRC